MLSINYNFEKKNKKFIVRILLCCIYWLSQYIFPTKINFLFAFWVKIMLS